MRSRGRAAIAAFAAASYVAALGTLAGCRAGAGAAGHATSSVPVHGGRSFEIAPMRLSAPGIADVTLDPTGIIRVGDIDALRIVGPRVLLEDGRDALLVAEDGSVYELVEGRPAEHAQFRMTEEGDLIVLANGSLLHIAEDGAVVSRGADGSLERVAIRLEGFTPRVRRTALVLLVVFADVVAAQSIDAREHRNPGL